MPAADALRLHPRAQAHRGEFHVVLAVNVHEAVSGLWLVCIPVWRVWACSVLLVIVCGVSIISDAVLVINLYNPKEPFSAALRTDRFHSFGAYNP